MMRSGFKAPLSMSSSKTVTLATRNPLALRPNARVSTSLLSSRVITRNSSTSSDKKPIWPTSVSVNAVSLKTTNLFHRSSQALAILFPAALVLSPSTLNVPVDVLLSTIIPYHAYVGLNSVISDYVPHKFQGPTRVVVLVLAVVATLGMLLSTFQGIGPTEAVKNLWRA